jgi:hypothetical protein
MAQSGPFAPRAGWMAMAITCLWALHLSGFGPTANALATPSLDADIFHHHGNFTFDRRLLALDDESLVEEMRWLLDDLTTLRMGRRRRDRELLGLSDLKFVKKVGLADVASCALGIVNLVEARGNPYAKA